VTSWVLRLELRRSAAFLAAALSLPTAFVAAGVAGQGMRTAFGDARTNLVMLVPLALGVGAWQARRDRRSRVGDLLATTARPSWQRRLHIAVPLGIGAATGFLAVFAGLVVFALVVDTYVPPSLVLPAMAAALTLAAGVWLGAALGRALPWVVMPPLIVVAGLVGLTALVLFTDPEGDSDGLYPRSWLLNPTGTEGFSAFETLTTPVLIAQVLWMVALAAACLLLYVAARFWRLLAVVPIVLGLVLAGPLLPDHLHEGVTLDRGALALECTPDEPRICVRRVYPRLLDQLRDPGRDALAILAAKLPQAPTSVVQQYSTNDSHRPSTTEGRADTVYVELHPEVSGRVNASASDLRWLLLMGAGTPMCELATDNDIAGRLVAAAWLLEEEPLASAALMDVWGELPPITVTRPAYEALLALPPDEQRARVAALREAELECTGGDRLELLIGDGRSS
jgi:hypothetical protein